MLSCAAVVVTFFPDQKSIETIKAYTDTCDLVVVVDNTPGFIPNNFPEAANLVAVRLGENLGLATALNRGIYLAGSKGYRYLFLFDQDSSATPFFFHDMLRFKIEMDKKYSNCAICAPNFFDRNSQTFSTFPVLSRFTLRHVTCENIHTISLDRSIMAITSGSLLDYNKVKVIGGMREDYFIDFIDNEYCMRAHAAGFRILINCNAILDHSIGKRIAKKFFFLTVKPNYHFPVRRYYIARNGLKTAIDYKKAYPSYFFLIIARLIHEALSIILYERGKTAKLRAMLWGGYHALIGKMGKCSIRSITEKDADKK